MNIFTLQYHKPVFNTFITLRYENEYLHTARLETSFRYISCIKIFITFPTLSISVTIKDSKQVLNTLPVLR